MVNGKLVVYDQAHLSTDQASSGSPPEAPFVNNNEQPSYAEVTVKELSPGPTSTGLEESLAKLTSSSEISQGQVVSRNRKETGGQLAAGTPRLIPGLTLDPPKETPAEKRKQKRIAAKAAKAAKVTQAMFCSFCAIGTNSFMTLPLRITSKGGVFVLLCCFCNSGGGLVKSELLFGLLTAVGGCR